ncbi:dihydrofolate reductase [Nitrosomonas sp. HPC101]|uniref:dihydrofolate reductase n=1 Tax=Nitrosomonas sp. HPC101 TaxID=1658667 RepID=UPI00136AD54F|nr:dihydrofolate reductase [Nitrosomonas sp. HPC101]MXS85814.1 dihydrofolate reductase [Nitrosomonas sp. HPC101]
MTGLQPVIPRLAILAAVAANRVIGRNNSLPWHLPADLKHFKQLTIGQIVVMGRRTYDSIGKPLPGRTNVVLTRQHHPDVPGIITAHSIQEILDHFAQDDRQIFIIGGADLYQQTLPICQHLYLTEIQQDFAGDTFFPEYDRADWQEISREIHHVAEDSGMEYHFVVLSRKQS